MNQDPANPQSDVPEPTPQPAPQRDATPLEPATQIVPAQPGPFQQTESHAQAAQAQIVHMEAPKRGGWRQVGCAILFALAILGCVAFSVGGVLLGRAFVDSSSQFDAATGRVVSFCGAEGAGNYAQAYSYFSPTFKKTMTLNQFIQRSLAVTQKSGAISQCEIDSTSTPQQSGATFTVDIDVSRSDNSATTGTIYLVSDGHGGWLIDNVAAPLGLF